LLFVKAEEAGIHKYFKDDNAEKGQKDMAEAGLDTPLMLKGI